MASWYYYYLFILKMEGKANKSGKQELTKDQKLDKVFWFKIGISLLFGITFGVVNFTGFFAFLM